MKFEIENHRLYRNGNPVSWKPSPNHGGEIEPELIIVHYDGTNGTGGLQWLTTPGSGVSAHLWIAKSGIVWQLLPFNIRAWHAGASEWNGRRDCNSWSVGIENQGLGDEWPEAQIQANIGVFIALYKAYNITNVVGHEDVCVPEGRKVDPGPEYPWDRIDTELKSAWEEHTS